MCTNLFLQVLYSTLSIGLHDSFLPSFCIFPELEKIVKYWTTFQTFQDSTINVPFQSLQNWYTPFEM